MRHVVVLSSLIAIAACAASPAVAPDPLADVRDRIGRKDFAGAERSLAEYRSAHGVTPAWLDALSVLAQGTVADGRPDAAEALAGQTYEASTAALGGRTIDAEPRLPLAMGRAVEILAQSRVKRGARTEALAFLDRELTAWRGTSIEKRIQKNINLLTLEGTLAPPLDLSESLGASPPALASLKGRVVLIFFWAHWCADCKAQAPILANLAAKYGDRGLAIVAPTQRYGYVAGGRPAPASDETPYIDEVRRTHYPALSGLPIPLSEANHRRYGVSSTPTLVLIDATGVVRLYHPGRLGEADLAARIQSLLGSI